MRNLLLMTAMLGLVGCVGGLEDTTSNPDDNAPQNPNDPTPTPTGTARAMYESQVHPIIAGANATSNCQGCHVAGATAGGAPASSGFLAASASASYDIIVTMPNITGNFSANAKLVTYVTQQAHQGKSYTTDEIGIITTWLATELEERATQPQDPNVPEGPGAATERILGNFSACMTQEIFNQAQMAEACGNMDSTNNTECDNCHNTGGEGFVASRLSTQFFELFSTNRTFMQKYFMVAGAENPATAKIDRNLPMFQAVLNREGIYFEHPRTEQGTPTNNPCTQAMTTFQGLVQARIDAGAAACGPSKLVD